MNDLTYTSFGDDMSEFTVEFECLNTKKKAAILIKMRFDG